MKSLTSTSEFCPVDEAKRRAAIQRLDSVLMSLRQARTLGVEIESDIIFRIEQKLMELGG